VYPHKGYFENSNLIKPEIEFHVVDSKGNLLFTESNANLGAFKSIGTKAKEVVSAYAAEFKLEPYEKWRDMMAQDMVTYHWVGYSDNWAYAETVLQKEILLGKYQHLGLKFQLWEEQIKHKISERIYKLYSIKDKETLSYEAICGYRL
jgi:hypothetical protein